MRRVLIVALAVFLTTFGLLAYFNPGENGLFALYDRKFQTPLFTGFLTISGFLLTLKTFVLVQLKKELYDQSFYKEDIDYKRLTNPKLTLYGPLNRLASLLVLCVLGGLTTAVSQLSVGFIPSRFAAAFCIAVGAGTLALVFQAWYEIRRNLTRWFEVLEENNKKNQSEQHAAVS